jgi:hypothetical protein
MVSETLSALAVRDGIEKSSDVTGGVLKKASREVGAQTKMHQAVLNWKVRQDGLR